MKKRLAVYCFLAVAAVCGIVCVIIHFTADDNSTADDRYKEVVSDWQTLQNGYKTDIVVFGDIVPDAQFDFKYRNASTTAEITDKKQELINVYRVVIFADVYNSKDYSDAEITSIRSFCEAEHIDFLYIGKKYLNILSFGTDVIPGEDDNDSQETGGISFLSYKIESPEEYQEEVVECIFERGEITEAVVWWSAFTDVQHALARREKN
ncbi:MAG: hypothetical protein IK055_08800 [Lachnospiraceae bacterium]|nr:hypothetical protein [Lachnospiraceae bacterium]